MTMAIELLITALTAGYFGMSVGAWLEGRSWSLKCDLGLRKAFAGRSYNVYQSGEIEEAVENILDDVAKICDRQALEWNSDRQISEKNYAAHCAYEIRDYKRRLYVYRQVQRVRGEVW